MPALLPPRCRPFPSRRGAVLLVALAALLLPAAQATGAAGADSPMPPPQGRELIWDTRAQRALTRSELEALVARTPYVLLGEVHDNREQHRRQRDLLAAMVATGRHPALVMEQFDGERQSALYAAQLRPDVSAESLRHAGRFSSAWSWPNYAPLVSLALEHRLPVRAGNLSRERAQPVVRQGFAALPRNERQLLALDEDWSDSQEQALRQEITESHCGQLDSEAGQQLAAHLAAVQRWRDGTLAEALLETSADQGGAVAILGNGHVRRDLGVPSRLAARGMPTGAILALGQIEWRDGATTPAGYPEAQPDRYDVVWFSPREERADPCAAFAMPKHLPGNGTTKR